MSNIGGQGGADSKKVGKFHYTFLCEEFVWDATFQISGGLLWFERVRIALFVQIIGLDYQIIAETKK